MKLICQSILILALTGTASGVSAQENPEKFIGLMSQYLGLANQVVDTASRPEATVFIAIEGIFEIYEKRRDVEGAIHHLEDILAKYGSDPTVRNLARLKLRDVYKESGQADKALEQLDLLIKENAR
jgi:predicted negative regulator of RcsB-dependent stress response